MSLATAVGCVPAGTVGKKGISSRIVHGSKRKGGQKGKNHGQNNG